MEKITKKEFIQEMKEADVICFLGATFSYTPEQLSEYYKKELPKVKESELIKKFGRTIEKINDYQIEFKTSVGYSHYRFHGGMKVFKENNLRYVVQHDNIVVYMLIKKEENNG